LVGQNWQENRARILWYPGIRGGAMQIFIFLRIVRAALIQMNSIKKKYQQPLAITRNQ
jgi:hypothetical protein